MEKNTLSRAETAALKHAHRQAKSRKQADRIKTVLCLNEGLSYLEVAKLLLLDDATVRRYERCYKEKGLEGLLEGHYHGREALLTEEQKAEIAEYVDTHHIARKSQVQKYIHDKYGIRYSLENVRLLLLKLGFSYRKPQLRPAKLNVQQQEGHKQRYQEMKDRLDKENAALYFSDAVHPTMDSKPAYGWMRRGKPKTLLTSGSRKRVNIQGAIDIQNEDSITLSAETINADSTILLLSKIRDKNLHRDKIYVILDNAKVHHAKKVKAWLTQNPKMELVFLPPYSPNLNPIERLWRFMHKKVLDNRCFEDFEDFKKHILKFFRRLHLEWDELRSLVTDSFQTFEALPSGT